MQRQPTLNAGYLVVEVMVPSQGTNAIGSRVSLANPSLAGWTVTLGGARKQCRGVQLLCVWNDQMARLFQNGVKMALIVRL